MKIFLLLFGLAILMLILSLFLNRLYYKPTFGELIINVDNPTDDDIFKLIINDDPNRLVNRKRIVLKVIKK